MQTTGTEDEPLQLGAEFLQDPHEVSRLLRAEAPVRPVIMPRGLRVWLVTGYADARTLLADHRLSKDSARASAVFERRLTTTGDRSTPLSRSLAAHMLNSDPPDHTRLRKLVGKAFTARTVARLRPRIEEIADRLLDDMAGAREVDLLEAFAFPLPITVICELLGVPDDARGDFRAWSGTLLDTATPEQFDHAAGHMAAYLAELVARKRAAPTDDLLSALVHATDEGDALSEEELVSMAFLLLVAGHETTVNLIGNGVLALLREPGQLAALRADPALLPNAVEEFLRYEGPVHIATLRFTTEPVPVGGTEIPAEEFVMISLLAADRDPARFGDPDRLDITRPAGGHLAFGHGIHYCLGAPLARLEGEIAIGRLLARYGGLRLVAEPETLRWRDSTLIRGLQELPVRLQT
ncbi:cytochrome P450 family protein [Qaidamihabitans albus]|uniref:cytochrome P450 family protein n=1 Tax=Qaidamihabitans albus TaxID=2795733 RepID=UPI0018F249FC|nr:cytochrome P450 [Qaidamihabitans albus]